MALQVRGPVAVLAFAIMVMACGLGLAQDQPAPAAEPSAPAPAATGARPSAGQPIPPAELQAFVDGLAAQAMARDHIAGAAVAVVQDGQVVFKKGYGFDRLSPARAVDPDRTLFRLGSVTSTFTWIALMREIEAGHIRLDAPINVYLPQKDQVPDQGYRRPILVRDLLANAAGFEERSQGQLMERNPERIRPLEVYLRQERPRRVRDPGEVASHSDYGVALAGEALSQVTVKLPQALVDAEVAAPLGLKRTTLREPYPRRADLAVPMDPALAEDVSQGLHWTGSGFKVRPFEYMTQIAPALAGSSSAADMARYMLAILADGSLEGQTIYSPSIARQFRTRVAGAGAGSPGFDHGFAEYALPGGTRGYGQEGSTLSFRAKLMTAPDLKLGVFVAANTDTADAFVDDLASQIVQRFYVGPPALAPAPSDWLLRNASAFAGSYLTTRRAYHGLESFADLLGAETKVSVGDNGELLTFGADGLERWSPDPNASLEAPNVVFHRVGGPEQLVFEIQDGRANRWFEPHGEAAFERSGPLSHPWMLATLAAAAAAAAVGTIGGVFLRDRREFRQTSIQGRADAAQVSASILWLAAIACFFAWRAGSQDAAVLMYDWPGPWLLISSACAFVATVMTAICLGLAPIAWRGGRRLDSWDGWRKTRFTVTTVIFTLFAALVGLWGGLEPWSR
jgi:CubicO group peptidase (beta-lactamase class C family)